MSHTLHCSKIGRELFLMKGLPYVDETVIDKKLRRISARAAIIVLVIDSFRMMKCRASGVHKIDKLDFYDH